MNKNQEIVLLYEKLCINYNYYTFIRNKFVHCSDVKDIHGKDQKFIFIYSTRTKNNKWKCKKIYKIPENFELISVSEYKKIYLLSNNYVYAWDTFTRTSIRIFVYEKEDEECKVNKVHGNYLFIFNCTLLI
jgi:hypothetical protein